MQQSPPRQRGSGQPPNILTFEAKLQDEEQLLDSMLASLTRGALVPGVWDGLHAAAQRDERLSELAFAFERVAQGARFKASPAASAAEFLFQASRYFNDVFGDVGSAISYLERALTLLPTHAPSFERIEQLLKTTRQWTKLAEVYVTAAQHLGRAEQAPWLRRAADLLSEADNTDERVVELLQQVLRLEPGDEQSRAKLEALYLRANRLRDIVRLNEQALSSDATADPVTRKKLLARLIELYEGKLHEPERAMPHVEQLLAIEPADEAARKVAQKLIVIKGLAGRAAAALVAAAEAVGTPEEISRYLLVELENTRGPKRAPLLGRLGRLKHERMGDEKGAFDALEQALAIDPSDDALRDLYLTLAVKLQRWNEAAKTLGRVLSTSKDPAVKSKASAQIGEMLLRAGDKKRAKAMLLGVLGGPDSAPGAVLASAYLLRELLGGERDARALCTVLEKIAALDPTEQKRNEAAERLADLAMQIGDRPRAIAAYERLLSTSSRATALEALVPLYEASRDPEKRARLLEERARDTPDDAQARAWMLNAALVRANEAKNASTAIATYQAVIQRFGPARDVLDSIVPLLEAERRWTDLAQALEQAAALTRGAEHAEAVSRLGLLRLNRLRDLDGAIEAFDEALAFDAREKTARSTLEKLTAMGERRLQAARVLEALYRRESASGPLLRMLELRGSMAPEVTERLEALREAADLAVEAGPAEAARAVDAAGRGLAEAVAGNLPLREWLDRIDRVAGGPADSKRRAAVLGNALADRAVTSDELCELARSAAEANASIGDVDAAVGLYRRALAFQPHSTSLLSSLDELLRDQGNPEERVTLYRAALESATAEQRKALLHSIGAIQRRDIGDAIAAIATFRAAVDDDPKDAEATTALAELYAEGARWNELCALLEGRLAHVDADAARATRANLVEISAAHGDEVRARTQSARLLEDVYLAPEHLDAIERAADRLGDIDLARAVLHRRAEMTQDPREQVMWLDKLGELERDRREDLEGAAAAWKRAAALAEATSDDESARRLYGQARQAAPEDRESTARLAALCERNELWSELPALYAWLAAHATNVDLRVDLWLRAARVHSENLKDVESALRCAALAFEAAPTQADVLTTFEKLSAAAGAVDAFERAVDDASRRFAEDAVEPGAWTQLLVAKVRTLAKDVLRKDDAARACRELLADSRVGRSLQAEVLEILEGLIAGDPQEERRRADRRWMLEWRAEHATEGERVGRLLEWVREEETTFAEPVRALALHRRVLAIDPECDESLAGVARLALAAGETDEALAALRVRRDRANGSVRIALDLQMAEALLSHATRWPEALTTIQAILAEAPNDATGRAHAARLLTHHATRAGAVAVLEQACDATDDMEAREQILTCLLESPPDTDVNGQRRRWVEMLCDLKREQGRMEQALATLVEGAREMPDVPALLDRAEGLARELGRPDEVAALYQDLLARQLSPDQVRSIGARAVEFHEEWFEEPVGVAQLLERVLQLDGTAEWAFDRLRLILDSAERWDDLFALYDRALESAQEDRRAALLEDAARTAKDFADRPDRAIHYLEKLRALRSEDPKLVSALERLYQRQGRHRELVSLLAAQLPSLPMEDAGRARTRIAKLWLDELGDAAASLDAVEPLLRRANDRPNEPSTEIWTLVERILAATSPSVRESAATDRRSSSKPDEIAQESSGLESSVRQRAASFLREYYARSHRDADLARVRLVELEAVVLPHERVRRHLEVVDLFERVGDHASALEQVAQSVVLDPTSEIRREKLAELADTVGRPERLADTLVAAAEVCTDTPLRIALTMQAASVRADRMGDTGTAISLLLSMLDETTVTEEEGLAVSRKLEPLLETAGRDEERLSVLERMAYAESSGTRRRETLGGAAQLAARLGQNRRAISLWEKCIAYDEGDAEALDALVDLLDQEKNNERLAEVLALRAGVGSSQRQRSDLVRLAKLMDEVLERQEEAIELWRKVERDFGEADDVALALSTLLFAAERWAELSDLLGRGAQRTSDEATRTTLLRQLGDVQRERLGQENAAVETYARALAADARCAGARAGLFALATHEDYRRNAIDALLLALRSCDDWQAILELTSHRLLAATSQEEQLMVLREAADIAEWRADDPGLAFEAVRRAFVIAPADASLTSEIARLAGTTASWRGLVDAYREAIEGAARHDRILVAKLRATMGMVLETYLDDRPAALSTYLAVVRDTGDLQAASAAVRVAANLGHWDAGARVVTDLATLSGEASTELLDAYERAAGELKAWDEAAHALAEMTASADLHGFAARDVEARVAVWHRDKRGDADAAEGALKRALVHDEANPELLAELAQLQRRNKGRPLISSLLSLSRAIGGDLALLREAAEVACVSIGDRQLGLSVLGELFELARSRWLEGNDAVSVSSTDTDELAWYAEWAVESLARLHEEEGNARAIVDVLVAGEALPFDALVRRELRRRAARIAVERLGDDDLAATLYIALFDEDPHDAEAADRLATIYVARGRLQPLLNLRERQVAAAPDSGRRIALRLDIARLLAELGDPVRASETLRVNLEEDGRHAATVEALATILAADPHSLALRDLLAEQAQRSEQVGDATRAAELWSRLAVVAEQQLGDAGAAETYHERVVAIEPNSASLESLARLATARGDSSAAAVWLERLIEVAGPTPHIEIVQRLAESLVNAGHAARAAEKLEQALIASPDAESVRVQLSSIYRENGDWSRLAQLIAGSAAHAPDKAMRMARLLEAADLLAERCGQPERAVFLLEQAIDLAPDQASVRLKLADVLAQARQFDGAHALLRGMIEEFGGRRPKERAPVHYQIARLELAMGNRARALVELDAASRVDPQDPQILQTLAELARDDEQWERAEKSYRGLLVILRRREEAGESIGIARCEVLLELSAIARRQGEAERASEILESALDVGSGGEFEQERLEASLRARGDYDTLVRVLETRLVRLGDSPSPKILAELADVLANRLARPAEALRVRLRAVAVDPTSDALHDAALVLARGLDDVQRYVESTRPLVDRAMERCDVELACSLLMRLGKVAAADIGDDRRSAAFFEHAVDLGLRSTEVLRALDRAYERLGEVAKQARLLLLRIDVEEAEGGPRAASDALYRLAALRLASPEALDDGVDTMRRALDLDAQLDRAEDVLRSAVVLAPKHRRLLDLYEHIGRNPGHERALVEALKLKSQLPGAAADAVREAFEVAVRIGDLGLAESLLERFVDGDRTSNQNVAGLAWALGALGSLRERAGDLRGAVELKKAAAQIADPEMARKLRFEVAGIAANGLGDLALAADTYEALHEAQPEDREAWEPLASVYRRLGNMQKVADLMARVIDFVDDAAERARLRLERVRAMIDLGLPDAEAMPLLREIVEEDAGQIDASLMLATILERNGALTELADLLTRQIDMAKDRQDAASVASLALRLGFLLERVDRGQARDAFYVGLDWEPQNRELLDALVALLVPDADLNERADLLERRLSLEHGPPAVEIALSLLAARMDAGDQQGAERALELGFRAHPASSVLRERLEEAYRAKGEWGKLADLCVLDAGAREQISERIERLREAAAIWRNRLKDAPSAASALRLAREVDPDDTVLLHDFVEALMEAGDTDGALRELGTAIDSAAIGNGARAALLAARARICTVVGDEVGSVKDLEDAFAIDRAKYAGPLAAQLERAQGQAEGSGDAAALRALRMHQAEILPFAGDPEGARAILGEMVKQDPKDIGALRALADLDLVLERWDEASATLRRLVGLEQGEAAVETTLRLAKACRQAGRPSDAQGAIERAHLVAPRDPRVHDCLKQLYAEMGAWGNLANLALDDARASGDVAERFAYLLRAGSLFLEKAEDPEAALAALEEARALRPTDTECVGLLADALIPLGRAPEALTLLDQIIAPVKGRRARDLAPFYARLARAAQHTGDSAGEIRSLVQALECDPQNGGVCSAVATRAIELEQWDLANRALRAVTLLKTPGPMSKGRAYQHMGELAEKSGDSKRALMLLKRALVEDAGLERARLLVEAIENRAP